jgi:hypothetical protein
MRFMCTQEHRHTTEYNVQDERSAQHRRSGLRPMLRCRFQCSLILINNKTLINLYFRQLESKVEMQVSDFCYLY